VTDLNDINDVSFENNVPAGQGVIKVDLNRFIANSPDHAR
jgi:hypothetical protein